MCLPLYGAVGGASGAQGALSFILSVGASMLVSEKKAAEKQQKKTKKKILVAPLLSDVKEIICFLVLLFFSRYLSYKSALEHQIIAKAEPPFFG